MSKRILKFSKRGVIAVIPFSGTLSMRSVEPYIDIIERVEKMRKVKGAILKLSSQGGGVTASEVLYMALTRLKEKKRLFVWTTMAASGGYYAAAAAEKIFAPPSAIVGSIGVLSLKPVISGVMKKLGLKVEVTKEGRLKDDSLFFQDSTAEGKRKIKAINREVYEDFIEVVSKGRGLDKNKVKKIATGEIFTAKKGVELGLVDSVCDFREVKETLAKEVGVHPEKVIYMRPRKPLLSSLVERGVTYGLLNFFEELFSPREYYF